MQHRSTGLDSAAGRWLFLGLAWLAILTTLHADRLPAQDPPVNAWREVSAFSAPEAHQAAAADERYVYAIASRQAAKYDRRTGERLALSSGDALHLNSGFLWEGRLYCAHSNHPQKPDLSQIKALDPETMRWEDVHDFGQSDGSLTWAVRRGDDWWCHFAYYNDENHKSALVRFGDRWRETGRWRYPDAVLKQLGRHSLSGGLWRDDLLVVSDHDNYVLYRLRLPQSGDVLEYVDQLPSPFAGQGFAEDPLTGGLVGIERSKKRVIFAQLTEPAAERGPGRPLRLRVLSYNIHHGEGIDGRLDLERIAGVIRQTAPDLVALQEVDRRTQRTGQVDQPEELARLCGMHVAFGGNIDFQGGKYGNAVLSRWPIARHQNHLLPSLDNGEQRGVLDAWITLPAEAGEVRLLATHLDARRGDDERFASAQAINALLAAHPDAPTLLTGDLNDLPDSRTLQELRRYWQPPSDEPLLTIPVDVPRRQIDYVLAAPASRWRPVSARVIGERLASDHRPLLAVWDLAPAAPASIDGDDGRTE